MAANSNWPIRNDSLRPANHSHVNVIVVPSVGYFAVYECGRRQNLKIEIEIRIKINKTYTKIQTLVQKLYSKNWELTPYLNLLNSNEFGEFIDVSFVLIFNCGPPKRFKKYHFCTKFIWPKKAKYLETASTFDKILSNISRHNIWLSWATYMILYSSETSDHLPGVSHVSPSC